MLLSKLGIFIDIIGTTLLALDVIKREYLRKLRHIFSNFSTLNISFSIIRKKELTGEDQLTLSVVKSIGIYFSFITLLILAMFRVNDTILEYAFLYPISCLALSFIAQLLPPKLHSISRFLIWLSTWAITPIVYLVFFIFLLVSFILQAQIKFSIFLEKWCEEDQAPRVLGLLVLFLGFVLQLIGTTHS